MAESRDADQHEASDTSSDGDKTQTRIHELETASHVQLERISQLQGELEITKAHVRILKSDNEHLRRSSVSIISSSETAQESVANRLLRYIETLKRERGEMFEQMEAEEEFITNALQRRLEQLQREKIELENALEQEQECIVNRLQKQMESLRSVSSNSSAASFSMQASGEAPLGASLPSEASSSPRLLESMHAELNMARVRAHEREMELNRAISALQAENHHLVAENLVLRNRLRRSSLDDNDTVPTFPQHHLHSPGSESASRRSGSIAELRHQSTRGSTTSMSSIGSISDSESAVRQGIPIRARSQSLHHA